MATSAWVHPKTCGPQVVQPCQGLSRASKCLQRRGMNCVEALHLQPMKQIHSVPQVLIPLTHGLPMQQLQEEAAGQKQRSKRKAKAKRCRFRE